MGAGVGSSQNTDITATTAINLRGSTAPTLEIPLSAPSIISATADVSIPITTETTIDESGVLYGALHA